MKLDIYINNRNLLGLILSFMLLIIPSCTDNFEGYNTDKDKVTDEMLGWDMLGLGGFIPTMQIDVIPTKDIDANDYQRAQNLTGDIFSGYMAAIGPIICISTHGMT